MNDQGKRVPEAFWNSPTPYMTVKRTKRLRGDAMKEPWQGNGYHVSQRWDIDRELSNKNLQGLLFGYNEPDVIAAENDAKGAHDGRNTQMVTGCIPCLYVHRDTHD